MKKIIFISLGIGLMLFGAYSCRKDNINGDSKTLISGSYITVDSVVTENLDFSNQAATVAIMVGSKGSPVASINIFAATGSNALDTTGWVLIKNVPYTDGVTLSVSTAELGAALAPTVIAPGNQYILQNQVVTKDGRKFSVANTPSTYNSFPAYNMALTWSATAVCAYSGTAAGSYKVIEDDWVDWNPGDIVTVTDGPGPNQINLSQVWPNPAYGTVVKPLTLNVDPTTGAATAVAEDIGDYGYILSVVSGSGFVFSCTGTISVKIDLFAAGYGDQGPKKLILLKQ